MDKDRLDDDMKPAGWEAPVRFLCNYWWIVGLLVLIGLVIFFTRGFGLF